MTSPIRLRAPSTLSAKRWGGAEVLAFAVLTVFGCLLATQLGGQELLALVLIAAGVAVITWMTFTTRYALTLGVLLVYLLLADGYLKLRFNNDLVLLGRDFLLFAVAAGALVRRIADPASVRLPPLSAWIIAWVVLVLLQLFNPANGTTKHSLLALRPHLEFVPLFFLGYSVMRSTARLRGLVWLVVVLTAVNGYVGFVQTNLTRAQLAAWGPGYKEKIYGTAKLSGRGFVDDSGKVRTRPFALGSDQGFGGALGALAAPAVLALVALARTRRAQLAILPLGAGVIVAIITSQARVAILSALIALAAHTLLATASRRRLRTLAGVVLAIVGTSLLISVIAGGTYAGVFDRYESIAPNRVVQTAVDYRRNTIATIPKYATEYPLGAGIGTVGPGGSPAGGNGKLLNGESQYTFLLVETGIPGLIILVGLTLNLLWLLVTRIRLIEDPDARLLVAAVLAPLLAIFVSYYVGIATASTPGSAYFWLAAGVGAWWLTDASRDGGAASSKTLLT